MRNTNEILLLKIEALEKSLEVAETKATQALQGLDCSTLKEGDIVERSFKDHTTLSVVKMMPVIYGLSPYMTMEQVNKDGTIKKASKPMRAYQVCNKPLKKAVVIGNDLKLITSIDKDVETYFQYGSKTVQAPVTSVKVTSVSSGRTGNATVTNMINTWSKKDVSKLKKINELTKAVVTRNGTAFVEAFDSMVDVVDSGNYNADLETVFDMVDDEINGNGMAQARLVFAQAITEYVDEKTAKQVQDIVGIETETPKRQRRNRGELKA